MEPAGFALGVMSLTGVFTSCVECFEYIQLGQHIGKDTGTDICKLACAGVAFRRWGASLNIGTIKSELDSVPFTKDEISATTQEEFDIARDLLGEIEALFEDAKAVSAHYIKRHPGEDLEPKDLAVDLDGHFKKLLLAKRKAAARLQKQLSFPKKFTWAVYDKKKFERLIDDVSELVTQLVDMFPAAKKIQATECQREIEEIEDRDTLILSEKLAEEHDKILAAATKAHLARQGHRVEDFDVSGEGTVLWIGDKNAPGVASAGHHVQRFTISGGANGRVGNDNYKWLDHNQ